MGPEAMPRRQYEATWLGLPMKQVSLVTVGKLRHLDEYKRKITDSFSKLTVQNSALILVCRPYITSSQSCSNSLFSFYITHASCH